MDYEKIRKLALVRRIFAYFLMTIAVIALLFITVSSMLGYRFDFRTKTVEQTGLVQYDSFPRGATVIVDGAVYETTQTKGTVLPGQHQFTMRLEGYEDWNKTMDIKSGTLTWLNYARLVPLQKKITAMHDFANLDAVQFSPKRNFAIGLNYKDTLNPELITIDLGDYKKAKIKNYPIQKTEISGYDQATASHNFVFSKWDDAGRFVLVAHDYQLIDSELQREWLLFDKDNPQTAKNLSNLTGLQISSIFFANNGGDSLYFLQNNGDVRHLKVSDGTLSRPLLSNIAEFDLMGGNKIAYVIVRPHEKAIGVWKTDWQKPQDIKTFPVTKTGPLNVKISHYYHKDTVVFSDGAEVTIMRGDLPATTESLALFTSSAKTFTLGRPADIQISDSGRFIIAKDATGFVSYDTEHLSISQEIKLGQTAGSRPLRWLDEYYIWHGDDDQNLIIQEFDGLNAHKLLKFSNHYDVTLSQDGKQLYSFIELPEGGVQLRRLAMTAGN